MTATAWFLAPDDSRPVGGIRCVYQFVDDLVASDISAAVVHEHPGFRCTWFENDTPVIYLDDLHLAQDDLLVVPEISVAGAADRFAGASMLILNQNPYLTFHGTGMPPDAPPLVLPPTAVGIATVSEDALDYLKLAFPEVPVERLHYGVTSAADLRHRHTKERALAFMPRRRYDDMSQVLRILERRGSLDGWRLYPIDHMAEGAKTEVLERSAVFLSFNQQEGFGLPPIEAMAAGCIVIGYSGRGGREYMREDYSFPVDEGAIADFVRATERVLHAWDRGDRFSELTDRARAFVAENYNRERRRRDIVRVVSKAFDAAGATQAPVGNRAAT